MIEIKMTSELFNTVKIPLLITTFVVIMIIFLAAYFVSKEVKK